MKGPWEVYDFVTGQGALWLNKFVLRKWLGPNATLPSDALSPADAPPQLRSFPPSALALDAVESTEAPCRPPRRRPRLRFAPPAQLPICLACNVGKGHG